MHLILGVISQFAKFLPDRVIVPAYPSFKLIDGIGSRVDFQMKTLSISVVLVGLVTRLFALEDSPDNRAELADRLIRTFPVQDWWVSAERAMEATVQEDQRDALTSVLRYMNWDVIVHAMRQATIETYSVDEIQALIDAYSSPVGRSIMRNQGSYMTTEDLQAAEGFFSTPVGESIRKKQRIFASKMEPIYKQEILKAIAKLVEEASRPTQ